MSHNRLAAPFALTAGALLASLPANAACIQPDGARPQFSQPAPITTPYDPTHPGAISLATTAQIHNSPTFAPCTVTLALSAPDHLSSATTQHHLPLSLEGQPGASPLTLVLQPNVVHPIPVAVRLEPGHNIAPGRYAADLILSMFENSLLIDRTAVTVAADVRSVCTLPAPSPAQLDFSPGVATGRVQSGYRQTTVISEASCNGPSRLRLSGQPLATNQPPNPAYAATINYEATATFGARTASFNSAQSQQTTLDVPADTGAMTINITLSAQPRALVAGTYSSVLRVTLEPAN